MITSRTLDDIKAVLSHISPIDKLAGTDAFPEFDTDLIDPILEEAAKFTTEVLAPLNPSGDQHGVKLTETGVVAAPGFKEAYKAYCEGGWMGLAFPEAFGGQGLPRTLAVAVMEMVQATNMSFGLCPMLSFGAIEALMAHGGDFQKSVILPKLVSGEWTGTMNLTEPQAGSDVGALTTKAIPNEDGSYDLTGQKIYITWGDHDMTDNIIHLVLARLPDAPEGSRGISLFMCPKFLIDDEGTPGARNAARCIGLEKKLGIHASPTCVMEFDGAKAWMIGAPNKGLAAMFTMMNSARLQVGLQGVSQAEAACQVARGFASERKQGRMPGGKAPAAIINHPDVQNMLLKMRSRTLAARAICYECARASDLAEASTDAAARSKAVELEEILTPIAKAWGTDIGVEVASLGVQVHGGMGFMGETLASQIYRDVRIAPIYEGTNGIQAMDLAGRKLSMRNGEAMSDFLSDVSAELNAMKASNPDSLTSVITLLVSGLDAVKEATSWVADTMKSNPDAALFGATAYLDLISRFLGAFYLARGAKAAADQGSNTATGLAALARFFAETELGAISGMLSRIRSGEALNHDLRMELLA